MPDRSRDWVGSPRSVYSDGQDLSAAAIKKKARGAEIELDQRSEGIEIKKDVIRRIVSSQLISSDHQNQTLNQNQTTTKVNTRLI